MHNNATNLLACNIPRAIAAAREWASVGGEAQLCWVNVKELQRGSKGDSAMRCALLHAGAMR